MLRNGEFSQIKPTLSKSKKLPKALSFSEGNASIYPQLFQSRRLGKIFPMR